MNRSRFALALVVGALVGGLIPSAATAIKPQVAGLDVVIEMEVVFPGGGFDDRDTWYQPFYASGPAVDAGLMCGSGVLENVSVAPPIVLPPDPSDGLSFHSRILRELTCGDGTGTIRMTLDYTITFDEEFLYNQGWVADFTWKVVGGTGTYKKLAGSGTSYRSTSQSECTVCEGFTGVMMAKGAKVGVCHRTGNGAFQMVSIAESAVNKHLKHGDGVPGGAVPGMAGYTFDAGCVPVRSTVLVRATSTDPSGGVHLVAELVDTNGDGVISVGDTARMDEYPTDFDGTYADFDVRECVLDSVYLDMGSGHYYADGHANGDACQVGWMDFYTDPTFETFYMQWEGADAGGGELPSVNITDGASIGVDAIYRYNYIGGDLQVERPSTTDDGILDIEFFVVP